MIRRETLLQLFSHSGDDCVEPFFVSARTNKRHHHQMGNPFCNFPRTTQGDHCSPTTPHLGLVSYDAALESKTPTFFAQRTAFALSYVSYLTDIADPSCVILDPVSQADLLVRLRFSTHKLVENQIRPLTDQDLSSLCLCIPGPPMMMMSFICSCRNKK